MLLSNYGFFGLIKLSIYIVKTKLFYRNARIIRFPFRVRGKKFVDFGLGLTTGVDCRIDAFSETGCKVIFFGNNVQINDNVHIGAIQHVKIGSNVLIASKVFITDHNHGTYSGDGEHSDPSKPPHLRNLFSSPVNIEDNVWLGEFVTILPGVTIGEGSIIGSNSVVNRNIPPFSIAVGVPARVIKKYSFETKKWIKSE